MGGLFSDESQRAFLEESEEPAAEQGRRLNVDLPRVGMRSAESAEPSTSVSTAEPSEPSAAAWGERERQQDVVLRLSEAVVGALLAERDATGFTTTDVVLDAVDRVWHELDRVVPPAPSRTSPLPPRSRRRRPGGSQGQRVHLRLTPSERAILEDLVDHRAASNLTDLVERVLRHALAVDHRARGQAD